MNQITPENALKFIGNCLANESLKLSQKEHLTAIECYKVLTAAITTKEVAKEEKKDESKK